MEHLSPTHQVAQVEQLGEAQEMVLMELVIEEMVVSVLPHHHLMGQSITVAQAAQELLFYVMLQQLKKLQVVTK
jgi:hypothetical protein